MEPSNEVLVRDLADVGRAIRQRREQQGLTLDEAPDLYGVGRRLLVELEHGRRNVGAETLLHILNLLGYDVILRHRSAPPRSGD